MSRVFASRLSSVILCASALVLQPAFGQNPADLFRKAPPDVDEALRTRIAKFFQLQVDGKFRQAEEYVAEDSKDFYYEMRKSKYLSYEIRQIDYSDNYTKAKAIIVVEMNVAFPGLQGKPMPVPMNSLWKVVEGQWYWYIDREALLNTPFGKMRPPTDSPATAAAPLPDPSKGPDVTSLWKQVQADKRVVRLKKGEASSDQVTISSQMPGAVSLRLQSLDIPGLAIKLDRAELLKGDKAVLSFQYEPGDYAPHTPVVVNLRVQPINSVIPIQVVFQ